MEYFVAAPKANEIISRYRAFQEEVRPIAGEPCMAEVRERERMTILIKCYHIQYSDIQSSALWPETYVGRGERELTLYNSHSMSTQHFHTPESGI